MSLIHLNMHIFNRILKRYDVYTNIKNIFNSIEYIFNSFEYIFN